MIYSPEITSLILNAIYAVTLSNNGYADIGFNGVVADAVEKAGYTVIKTTDLFGHPVYRAFTPAAQAALAAEPFGVSTYKPINTKLDTPDVEGAILAAGERHLFA